MRAGIESQIHFSVENILGWEPHSFRGMTRYESVDIDGQSAIHATCTEASASGLFYRSEIDLTLTPIVEWRWRVDRTFTGNDERSRAGDDYPARLYLVDEYRVARWRTRALNYVWSSTQTAGAEWPNAYASQAQMIAVRGPDDAVSGWHSERRNVREDFLRLHGRDVERINAMAIMTDCDNTAQSIEAWYGEIRFLSQ